MTSDNQKRILRCFPDRETVKKKKDIISESGLSYYNNTEKYVGETLTRMVRNGMLKRVSTGKYKLGSGNKPAEDPDPNQTQITFE